MNDTFNYFKSILSTSTIRHSSITSVGTTINGALGALFYILLARFLGPTEFGLLAVAIAALTLIADIADLGTNTGIVKFVSSHIQKNGAQKSKELAYKFLKLALETKILLWIIVLIIGNLLAPFLAENIFQKSELLSSLRLIMVGVGTALLFSFAASSLQAFQKYYVWSLVNIVTNALRVLVILLLLFYQQLNLLSSLGAFIALPLLGFCLALLFLPVKNILKVKGEFEVARQFFKYNLSVGLFTLIAAVSSRLDTFLTARLLTSENLGIYSAANQLVQVVPQLVGALGVVAAPRFSSFQNREQMLGFFKKFQFLTLGIALLIILAIPLSFYLIPLVYGNSYSATVIPFIVLLLAMLVFLISIPLHTSIIFYFGKPEVFIWVSLGHLLVIGGLGYFMISQFGIVGAALTVLSGMVFNFFAPLIWFINNLKSEKEK